jgi:hypothetical protein
LLGDNPVIGKSVSNDWQPTLHNKKAQALAKKSLDFMKTNGNAEAAWNGVTMTTSAGPLTVASMKNLPIS